MSEEQAGFVDCHVHFLLEHFDAFVGSFEDIGLCGAWNIAHDPKDHGEGRDGEFAELLRVSQEREPGRVHTFYWPNYKGLVEPDFPARCARRIEELHALGIVGVKVWKDMGLGLKDPDGKLMMLDDERLNPIWETMVALKLILIAHVADPANFWLPMDESNPAFEALKKRPEWHFGKPGLPTREELYAARDRLHKRFPELVIVNCHCGGYVDTLDELEAWMDAMPNFYASVGRGHVKQGGASFARFLVKHADRVMFETDLGMRRGRPVDLPWNRDAYAKSLGFFRGVYALFDEEAFEQFSHGNAERLIAQAGNG